MRIFNKIPGIILSLTCMLGIAGSTTAWAATDPGLGEAATFSIIAQTVITGTGTISGDVGMNSTGAAITGLTADDVGGTIYSTDGVAPGVEILDPNVQADLSTANDDISGQGSDGSIGPALDGLVLTTGVYDIGAGRLNGGVLTLDGPGIYIFRASSDFISSGSIDLTNGARACDVYWQVDTLATINGSEFTGTIIAGTGVHFGANVTLEGRALALGGDVTLLDTTITEPSCVSEGTISVVKTVINDNGREQVVADFPLFVNGTPVVSGEVNSFPAPATYTITETADPNYTQTFSGDCDVNGELELIANEDMICIITNNDIAAPSSGGGGSGVFIVPPLIDVLKVPSPLALPAGPGMVTYTYTLSNIGTVPVTDITMVGDTCSPLSLVSGDMNSNGILEVTEIWTFTCSALLSETHTNIITATGWANGISAVDIASATVVVGVPLVPPLIHVTKIPSPLTLFAGGGMVTYTKRITNPGTVPLSNVRLIDDICSPVQYISGDTNGDALLDPTETWLYTCRMNLTATTTNTAIAIGEANGFEARDFAIATVVVAAGVPALPNTGLPLEKTKGPWNTIIPSGLLLIASTSLALFLRKRTIEPKR